MVQAVGLGGGAVPAGPLDQRQDVAGVVGDRRPRHRVADLRRHREAGPRLVRLEVAQQVGLVRHHRVDAAAQATGVGELRAPPVHRRLEPAVGDHVVPPQLFELARPLDDLPFGGVDAEQLDLPDHLLKQMRFDCDQVVPPLPQLAQGQGQSSFAQTHFPADDRVAPLHSDFHQVMKLVRPGAPPIETQAAGALLRLVKALGVLCGEPLVNDGPGVGGSLKIGQIEAVEQFLRGHAGTALGVGIFPFPVSLSPVEFHPLSRGHFVVVAVGVGPDGKGLLDHALHRVPFRQPAGQPAVRHVDDVPEGRPLHGQSS